MARRYLASKSRKASKRAKQATSEYLRFLSIAPTGKVVKSTLEAAPDPVIKVISNAALNALRGPVKLTPYQRSLFAKHRTLFKRLVSPTTSVASKRKALVHQRGGAFPLIPILIGSVLGLLGSTFVRNLGQGRAQSAKAT